MAKFYRVVAAATVCGAILLSPAGTTPPNTIPADVPIHACEFEDGYGQDLCYWDAETRGNGEGESFVKVGETYYYLA